MKKQTQQSGFAIVELVILVVVLAVLGGMSYFILHHTKKVQPATTASTVNVPAVENQTATTSTSVPAAPQVNSASDLNSAMQALNQTDMNANGTDSTQLGSQSSGF